MFDTLTSDDDSEDRGQVGIGTLIVFIAMVLVAAIAAGVLVNTAGVLQATAQDAGEQSVQKVTNRVEVVNTHGTVLNESIANMSMTVRLAAGSDSVNMNDTTIKYISDTSVVTLQNGTSSGTEFGVDPLKDADSSADVINSLDDRFEVEINASAIEGGDGLSTGETVKLEITTRTGGTTTVILTMPQQLAGKSTDDPVEL
jgi:flagellin FlaB